MQEKRRRTLSSGNLGGVVNSESRETIDAGRDILILFGR